MRYFFTIVRMATIKRLQKNMEKESCTLTAIINQYSLLENNIDASQKT